MNSDYRNPRTIRGLRRRQFYWWFATFRDSRAKDLAYSSTIALAGSPNRRHAHRNLVRAIQRAGRAASFYHKHQ